MQCEQARAPADRAVNRAASLAASIIVRISLICCNVYAGFKAFVKGCEYKLLTTLVSDYHLFYLPGFRHVFSIFRPKFWQDKWDTTLQVSQTSRFRP